jgi:hypothetical protein
MRNPRIQTLLIKELEIRPYHMQLRLGAFLVRNNAIKEPDIIMAKLVVLPSYPSVTPSKASC